MLAIAGFGKGVGYKISIDPAQLSGFKVEITSPDAKGRPRLAMAEHPEYDDRHFRYVENFRAESAGRPLSATKLADGCCELAA